MPHAREFALCAPCVVPRQSTLGDHEEESSIPLKVDTGKLDSPIYALCRTTTTARTQSVAARREDISGMVGGKDPDPDLNRNTTHANERVPVNVDIRDVVGQIRTQFPPMHRAPNSTPPGRCTCNADTEEIPHCPCACLPPPSPSTSTSVRSLTPHTLKIAYRRPQMRRTRCIGNAAHACLRLLDIGPEPNPMPAAEYASAMGRTSLGSGCTLRTRSPAPSPHRRRESARIRRCGRKLSVRARQNKSSLRPDRNRGRTSQRGECGAPLRAGHPSPALWDTGVNAPGRAATAQGKLLPPTRGWCRANTSTPRNNGSECAAPAPGLAKKAAAYRVSACCTAPIDSHSAQCMVHPDSQERACTESIQEHTAVRSASVPTFALWRANMTEHITHGCAEATMGGESRRLCEL
ncbi:hypothetical protein B0H13DRAFT_1891253 [Mycena leptocephala]|nr:hypothetical protein B0H13DRAFT_1891253 [Mycena leptocephala]